MSKDTLKELSILIMVSGLISSLVVGATVAIEYTPEHREYKAVKEHRLANN